jgi:hypothetical protein
MSTHSSFVRSDGDYRAKDTIIITEVAPSLLTIAGLIFPLSKLTVMISKDDKYMFQL